MRAILPLILAVSAAAATAGAGVGARAQEPLEDARRAYEDAEFQRALELLEDAEWNAALDRESLVLLLETRALAARALGDTALTRSTLQALASIDPQHAFGPEVPPELVAAFTQERSELRGPVRVVGRVEASVSGLRVVADVEGDVAGLVREVRVYGRADADAVRDAPGALDVPVPPGARVEWWAEALGAGGAVLARDGSRASPRTAAVPSGATTVAAATAGGSPEEGADDAAGFPWLWVGIAAGVALVAIIAIALAASAGSDDTDVGLRIGW
jgi:hypothetical protein